MTDFIIILCIVIIVDILYTFIIKPWLRAHKGREVKARMYLSRSWSDIIGSWVSVSIVFICTLFVNIVLTTFVGIVIGYLFSLTFIGTWINEGLNEFGIASMKGELYKIGAVAGFLSGFLKYSFSFKA